MKMSGAVLGSFLVVPGTLTFGPAYDYTYWTVPKYHTLQVWVYAPGGGGGSGAPGGNNDFNGNTGAAGSDYSIFYSETNLVASPGQGGTGASCSFSYWWNGFSESYSYAGGNGNPGANGGASGGSTNEAANPGGAGGNYGGYVGGPGGYGGLAYIEWTVGQPGAPVPGSTILLRIGTAGYGIGTYAGGTGTNGYITCTWS